MKKILAIIISAAMLMSAVCINTSAAETSKEKEELGELLDCIDWEIHGYWGRVSLYRPTCMYILDTAKEIYNNEESTNSNYRAICDILFYSCENEYIIPEFAEETYKMALNEQNYNNWYSDEDWTEFQNRISDLGEALDFYYAEGKPFYSSELTNAFHAVIKIYNEMTNEYTLKGDINGDGTVSVSDATLLQKYLAGTAELTGAQKMLANARKYENPTIAEATVIQKYCSDLIDEMPNNNVFISENDIYYTTSDSGEKQCYMDMDLLKERTINFNICPRTIYSGPYIPNNYTEIEYISGYYRLCYKNRL